MPHWTQRAADICKMAREVSIACLFVNPKRQPTSISPLTPEPALPANPCGMAAQTTALENPPAIRRNSAAQPCPSSKVLFVLVLHGSARWGSLLLKENLKGSRPSPVSHKAGINPLSVSGESVEEPCTCHVPCPRSARRRETRETVRRCSIAAPQAIGQSLGLVHPCQFLRKTARAVFAKPASPSHREITKSLPDSGCETLRRSHLGNDIFQKLRA